MQPNCAVSEQANSRVSLDMRLLEVKRIEILEG